MPWDEPFGDTQIVAAHAALLPSDANGSLRVLYIAAYELAAPRVFRIPENDSDPTFLAAPLTNMFCGGHAFCADGRLLVAGGHIGDALKAGPHETHYAGERTCWQYLPHAGIWRRAASLNFQPDSDSKGGGRWYPTLITLANGDILAVGGHPDESDDYGIEDADGVQRHNNNFAERYTPGIDTWKLLTDEPTALKTVVTDHYPRLHLMPSGYVFFSTVAPREIGPGTTIELNRFYDPFSGVFVGPNIVPLKETIYHRGSNATSVLLPLLPDDTSVWVLVCGGKEPHRINLALNQPAWEAAGSRQGSVVDKVRNHLCAVILPNGDVFMSGGCETDGIDKIRDSTAVRQAEIYKPGIEWGAGKYEPGNPGSWETVEQLAVKRHYHSVAVLLADGRVWTAGSNSDEIEGGDKRVQIFNPGYMTANGRPEIDDCPLSVAYEQLFPVILKTSIEIERVALTRCGSVTHAFDSDQRYVGLKFHQTGKAIEVTAPASAAVAPPGNYLLWVVTAAGDPCTLAKFVRVSAQECHFVTNRDTFSLFEVQALLEDGPAEILEALLLYFDGFLPHEFAALGTVPSVGLSDPAPPGFSISGMSLKPRPVANSDPALPDISQRIVFAYDLVFDGGTAIFDTFSDTMNVRITADFGHFHCEAMLHLTKKRNPYMLDVAGGNPPWLSTDLRAFRISPNQTLGVVKYEVADTPYTFLKKLLQFYNNPTFSALQPFKELAQDLDTNPLMLEAEDKDGNQVFNFAIAKVRFRAPNGTDASDVRVFFRLFRTVGTALEYDSNTTYRRHGTGSSAIPLLGKVGATLISIPFFASPRVTPANSMKTQTDDLNRRTLKGAGAEEFAGYFGCWLDLNQDTEHIPHNPFDDGPFEEGFLADEPLSVQELVRNYHQCLVAEVHFEGDPIALGETPGLSDNLAQRNLAFGESANPGGAATRTIHSTFEVKPSSVPAVVLAGSTVAAKINQVLPSETARKRGLRADELLLWRNNLPKEAVVSLYMPDVNVDEILRIAAAGPGPHLLERIDDHTIRSSLRELTFVPLPGGRTTNIPGLLSVELPSTVKTGQRFRLIVQQSSGVTQRIIGTFQITISVKPAADILPGERRKLSVLRHIEKAVPSADPWKAIFAQYIGHIGERIREFGGEPDEIAPSPTGNPAGGTLPVGPNELRKYKGYKGKIAEMLYDCFGDFEGFILELCPGERLFNSKEKAIEQIVRRACAERLSVTVYTRLSNQTRPYKIGLHC